MPACPLPSPPGELKLRLPSRLGAGTVKAAAWQVRPACWALQPLEHQHCSPLSLWTPAPRRPAPFCDPPPCCACYAVLSVPCLLCLLRLLLQVLAEVGPEGMHLEDIAREIQKRGFRDLRSTKTPESTGAWNKKAPLCSAAAKPAFEIARLCSRLAVLGCPRRTRRCWAPQPAAAQRW